MSVTCSFSQEEFLISSDLEKQAVKKEKMERRSRKREKEKDWSANKTNLSAFVAAPKHQKFLFKFPFVVWLL